MQWVNVFYCTGSSNKLCVKRSYAKVSSESGKAQSKESSKKAEKSVPRGKQTVGKLMNQRQGLTNIEITNRNIKSFERVANKYKIDFALKKDKSVDPPRYLVFFKAKDMDVMTAAFKEFSANTRVRLEKKISSVKEPNRKIEGRNVERRSDVTEIIAATDAGREEPFFSIGSFLQSQFHCNPCFPVPTSFDIKLSHITQKVNVTILYTVYYL